MSSLTEYVLGAKLGAGARGEVFQARRRSDGVTVVVKRYRPETRSDAFLDEARVLARLDHRHVRRVLDFGVDGNAPFVVLEHVAGDPLAQVRRREPLPPEQLLVLGAQAAAGLAAAHETRSASGLKTPIVHGDVSPSNLLITPAGNLSIIDFGEASLQGRKGAQGALPWSAPEALLEDRVSPESDQWSLGVVLWECLALRSAFEQLESAEAIRRITEEGLPPFPSELGIPEEVAELVTRMTALRPQDRWPSMREVAEQLRHLAQAEAYS